MVFDGSVVLTLRAEAFGREGLLRPDVRSERAGGPVSTLVDARGDEDAGPMPLPTRGQRRQTRSRMRRVR